MQVGSGSLKLAQSKQLVSILPLIAKQKMGTMSGSHLRAPETVDFNIT